MNNYLCFTILFCGISCYGQVNDLHKQDNLRRNNDDNKENKYLENKKGFQGNNYQKYDNYYEEYVGNPDFDAKIERPCHVYDLNCIRKYFAEHSKCKIRRGPLPRNLFVSQDPLYFSRNNLTVTLNNVKIGGFRSTRIEEFYLNKRTNMMVFAIQIRGFSTTIPSAYFTFYRSGREPITILSEAVVVYPSLTFTAVIPNIDDLRLDKAEITPYVDAVPFFVAGPEITNQTDLVVTQSFAELFADLPTGIRELMLTESQFFPPAYIQYNICDFGLKVTPVDTAN